MPSAAETAPASAIRLAVSVAGTRVTNDREVLTLFFLRVLDMLDSVRPPLRASAHCDLPCGVYDPAQARIEAESVKAIIEKYHESKDQVFRDRALLIKEERADLVKHHLWVLWTDYFKPEHLERFPNLHKRFWQATKLAGESKHSTDANVADDLLQAIDEISDIFWKTKEQAKAA